MNLVLTTRVVSTFQDLTDMAKDEQKLALVQTVNVLGQLDDVGQAAAVAILHDQKLERVLVSVLKEDTASGQAPWHTWHTWRRK